MKYYTATHSDLYWRVDDVLLINDDYVELEMAVFYKSNDLLCTWLTPYGTKRLLILGNQFNAWKEYKKGA